MTLRGLHVYEVHLHGWMSALSPCIRRELSARVQLPGDLLQGPKEVHLQQMSQAPKATEAVVRHGHHTTQAPKLLYKLCKRIYLY